TDLSAKYHFNGLNVGYGGGHNKAINVSSESKYHVIINPDIIITPSAIESFESFIKINPQSDYAPNALYWVGECHYSLSDLPRAKETFLKVADNYPKSSKAPDALLKLGFTLSALKEKERATGIFERIITEFPSSSAAIKARERLSAH
ncbi:MAG: tol-pal system protein YbgF, partial [Desulfuromonadales bacterium]